MVMKISSEYSNPIVMSNLYGVEVLYQFQRLFIRSSIISISVPNISLDIDRALKKQENCTQMLYNTN